MLSRTDPHLADFCAGLPRLRRAMGQEPGPAAELDAVLAAVREGQPVGPLLSGLGISPDDGEHRGPGAGVAGLRGGRGCTERYVCPAGLCARTEERAPGGRIPRCAVHDRPLEPDDLP
ncbi:hypothetical protein ACWD3J_28295 [Streptomyces sp. NPDC002755]|uniref:hypothetical protein n=1 Tax=Streptomyces sp. NPDC002884 TaxID=3154544 RepID=UPI00332443C1